MAVATDQGSSSAISADADSIGTGTYAPRLIRASHPARDQAANLRAATAFVTPRMLAASPAVSTVGFSRSSRLSCSRDVALRPDGFMRYILSAKTSLNVTFLRLKCSFMGFLPLVLAPTRPKGRTSCCGRRTCDLVSVPRTIAIHFLPEFP